MLRRPSAALAALALAAVTGRASADYTVKVKQVSGAPSGLWALSVTVTDPDHPNGVPNVWVRVQPGNDSNPVYVQTDSHGNGITTPSETKDPSPPNSGTVVDCKEALKDPGGSLHYNAATGALTYTGATVAQVFYSDMTSTTVNTPTETIIGASVELLGMHFTGIDAAGLAHFGDATLRIEDAQGLFFTASYDNVMVGSGFGTSDSILVGTLGNFSFDPTRVSRYDTELMADLAVIPSPTFYLTMDGNLADMTNNFAAPGAGGQDATVNVTTCPLGGGAALPEPSSVLLLAIGVGSWAVLRRRVAAQS